MSLNYVYEKAKTVVARVIGRKATLCYVRVRCPCCGMWTRLDNLKKDQPLFEESTCYSTGDKGLFHDRKINPELKPFWIMRLKAILARLGVVDKPYSMEFDTPYQYHSPIIFGYRVEKEVSYGYER